MNMVSGMKCKYKVFVDILYFIMVLFQHVCLLDRNCIIQY